MAVTLQAADQGDTTTPGRPPRLAAGFGEAGQPASPPRIAGLAQGFIQRRRIARGAAVSVTATTAPVSMSTACSCLCAKCVRPSFIFVIWASGSCGFTHSLFAPFLRRRRSSRASSSRVGVSMPEAFASSVRNAS